MKKIIFLLLILTLVTEMRAQRELTITEMESDDSAIIRLEGEDLTAPDFVQMELGFKQLAQASLRTLTDHDLSFWTKNTRRMTIKNNGWIGIGTSNPLSELFINNGRLGLETKTFTIPNGGSTIVSKQTGLDFYSGSDIVGGLKYISPRIILENKQDANVNIATNGLNRMEVSGAGDVKINSLAGTGTRHLLVEADGTLQAEDNSGSKYLFINPSDFSVYDQLTIISFTAGSLFSIDGGETAYYPLDLPQGSTIKSMKIYYIDTNPAPTFDLTVEIQRCAYNVTSCSTTPYFESIGEPSTDLDDVITTTVNKTYLIGDPMTEKSNLVVNLDIQTGISAIIVEYIP